MPVLNAGVIGARGVILPFVVAPSAAAGADVKAPLGRIWRTAVRLGELVAPDQLPGCINGAGAEDEDSENQPDGERKWGNKGGMFHLHVIHSQPIRAFTVSYTNKKGHASAA